MFEDIDARDEDIGAFLKGLRERQRRRAVRVAMVCREVDLFARVYEGSLENCDGLTALERLKSYLREQANAC